MSPDGKRKGRMAKLLGPFHAAHALPREAPPRSRNDVAPEKRPTPAPYGYGAVHVGGHARQRLPGMPCRRHEWRLARDTYGRPLALRLKIGRPLARLHDDGGHGHIALQFLQGTPKGARGAGRCFPKAHGQWKG